MTGHFPQWPEQDAMIESANWEIPGYATGVYHVLVHDGKVRSAQWCEPLQCIVNHIQPLGDVGTGQDYGRL